MHNLLAESAKYEVQGLLQLGVLLLLLIRSQDIRGPNPYGDLLTRPEWYCQSCSQECKNIYVYGSVSKYLLGITCLWEFMSTIRSSCNFSCCSIKEQLSDLFFVDYVSFNEFVSDIVVKFGVLWDRVLCKKVCYRLTLYCLLRDKVYIMW